MYGYWVETTVRNATAFAPDRNRCNSVFLTIPAIFLHFIYNFNKNEILPMTKIPKIRYALLLSVKPHIVYKVDIEKVQRSNNRQRQRSIYLLFLFSSLGTPDSSWELEESLVPGCAAAAFIRCDGNSTDRTLAGECNHIEVRDGDVEGIGNDSSKVSIMTEEMLRLRYTNVAVMFYH